jgi:hypothetical protein
MSQAAYLQAARDALQAAFNLDSNSCEVGIDGQPKPAAGQLYIALSPGSWTAAGGDDFDLDETFQIEVTVTRRLGTTPKDRWGVAVWLATPNGLETTCRKIITLLHMSYPVMRTANDYVIRTETGQSDYFHHPLEFQSAGSPILQGPDWFSAVPPATDQQVQTAPVGVSQALTFTGARRTQGVDNGMA